MQLVNAGCRDNFAEHRRTCCFAEDTSRLPVFAVAAEPAKGLPRDAFVPDAVPEHAATVECNLHIVIPVQKAVVQDHCCVGATGGQWDPPC